MLPLPLDTRRALGLREDGESAVGVDACESRSLLCDRYANPQLKEADRNAFFAGVAKRRAWTNKCSAWPDFLSGGLGLKPDGLLFAQLRSRLLVNMAGGVMENAGLCLDRFGVPYVPGSAVKGCARRMAIQRLLEEREAGRRPHELAALLVNIALVVGWGDTDWKAGRRQGKNGRKGELHSDFEFACGEGHSWRSVRDLAVPILLEKLAVQPQRSPREPWQELPNFTGSVSFLPGYPVDASGAELPIRPPPLGALELDVVTCHHPAYYRGDQSKPEATDDEDPIPVVFPAVAPGQVIVFALKPLRACPDDRLADARQWLADGLAVFGLGAKTAAGYGWFDTSTAVGNAVWRRLAARVEAELKAGQAQAEQERARQAEEARRKARAELQQATAGMSDEEKLRFELKHLQESQFLSKLDRWKNLSPAERLAIYHLMRSEKSPLWLDLREKATEGKQKEKAQWGHLVQDLFKMAKDRKEKMPS